MSNNGCGQLGAIQTAGTCWFYSILNGFILSEGGQKILYAQLKEFYNKLTEKEKEYFQDGSNAPCPLKDLTKVKKIYFWKFVDQYLCFMSGPRAKSLKTGRSVEMLKGMSLVGTVAREGGGALGGKPQEEITKILGHVGFKEMNETVKSHKDFLVVEFDASQKAGKLDFDHRKKPKFIIVKAKGSNYMESATPGFVVNDPDYSLMCSSIVIGNSKAKSSEMHKYHAVAGYTCNGNGYIYDSNQRKVFKCDYWDWPKLKATLDNNVANLYNFFKGGKINYYSIAFHVLARKDYVKHIGPACLMKYKTKTPNIGINFTSPNLGRRLDNNTKFRHLTPAERIALKRKWARTKHRNVTYLNWATMNALVNKATSSNNGYKNIMALKNAGYGIRNDDLNSFMNKLETKFKKVAPAPKPSPAKYTFANAKKHLNQYSTSGKAVRGHQYSLVWRGMSMPQRKVLMHWRNKGEWLANNAFENKGKRKSVAKPSPPRSASPATKRKTQLVANFEKYWTALSSENRWILRNWNNSQFKSPNKANELESPSPNKKSASPVKNLNAAKRNVNALKTAKARKEYRRTRAVNMTQNNWTELSKYIHRKNLEAMWARDAKREAKPVK